MNRTDTGSARYTVMLFSLCLLLVTCVIVLVCPMISSKCFIAKDPVSRATFIIDRGHRNMVPMNLLWSLEGFRKIHTLARYIFVGLSFLVGLLGLVKRERLHKSLSALSGIQLKWFIVYPILSLLAFTVFYVFRVSPEINFRFGDGGWLIWYAQDCPLCAAEALTSVIFAVSYNCLDMFVYEPNGATSIAIVSCLSGVVFLCAMWFFSKTVGKSIAERITLFLAGVTPGYTVMFYGYAETTQVELACAALYMAFSAKAIRAGANQRQWVWSVLALLALALAILAHAAAILLIPSCFALFAISVKSGDTWVNKFRRVASFGNIIKFSFCIVLPYILFIVLPFYAQGNFGNTSGGADNIKFVPLSIDYAHRASPYVYYSMFSAWHLMDIASAFFVAAPVTVPLLIILLLAYRRSPLALSSRVDKLTLWQLGLASLCVVVPLAWQHDYGMWGDWNIAAAYLFPLSLLVWTLFTIQSRKYLKSVDYIGFAVPLLVIQILMTVGFWRQFV